MFYAIIRRVAQSLEELLSSHPDMSVVCDRAEASYGSSSLVALYSSEMQAIDSRGISDIDLQGVAT